MAAQRSSDRGGPARRVTRVLVRAALALVGLMALAIVLYRFVPPVSTLMLARWAIGESATRDWVPLADISPSLPRAVIASEDSRFCLHNGVDWGALQDVIEDADEDGPSRGASTIAMQTVKNTLLWPGRSYIRKGLEIPLALITDLVWSKRRVMEIYLNVAEWGEGTFGAEAAAQRYFGKPARNLSPREAALLAAVLPNPIRRNAGRPSGFVARRAAAIARRMHNEDVACLAP